MSDKPLERPQALADLAGRPNKLYKLLKADQIHEDELDALHDLGFPDQLFDPENELHMQMHMGVRAARERLAEAKALAEEAAKQERIGVAKLFLAKNHPEVPVDLVEERILEEIGRSVGAADTWQEGEEIVTVVAYDEEELAFITASGEIVGFANAPRDDLDRRNILEWVGERLTTAQARQAGAEAEKAVWQRKIDQQYDPKINKQRRIQGRLKALYEPMAKQYLTELAEAHKGKSPLRSVKIGLLTLQFSKTSARVDILDEVVALPWAKANCPEAVKVEESILKTKIPAEIKVKLTEEKKAETGIFWYPGGEDKFDLK